MMEDKWFVLVNPAAGGFKAEKQWPEILLLLKKEKISFQDQFSKSAADVISIVTGAIQSGFRRFIAVGGDGTINLLINGVFHQTIVQTSAITVALIPVGTGNDWIRTHSIPKSLKKAVAIIKLGRCTLHDIGKIQLYQHQVIETKYFINIAGFGFQGMVAERMEGVSSGMKKGLLTFVLGIFDTLFKYHATEVSVIMDDILSIDGMIYNINAGICKFCGGGMKMTPNAITDDGLFDITIIRKIDKAEVILNVPLLFSGKFLKNKKVTQYRCKKLHITSIPLLPVECDGEVLGYGNATVEMLQKSIQVIIP